LIHVVRSCRKIVSFLHTHERKREKQINKIPQIFVIHFRDRAKDSRTYSSSVIPFGYAGVRKEEKVVFPHGTVYYLSALWMADPQLSTNVTVETQTPLMMLPSRMVTLTTNTELLYVRLSFALSLIVCI
jgi:hypothetical protein